MARIPPKPWKPGESGNPNGRPPGTGEHARLRAAIAKHVPGIVRAMVKKAKEGDAAAAKLLLERVLAPVKATEAPVALELGEAALSDQGRAILLATLKGELGPGQAVQLLSGISTLAQIVASDELAQRIAALEARADARAEARDRAPSGSDSGTLQ